MGYAGSTTVSVEKSRTEIESILRRYGVKKFMSGWDETSSGIGFECNGLSIQITIPLPNINEDEFRLTPSGKKERTDEQAYKLWEQACRSRWRSLLLVIKAKLEAIELGITTFEYEFMAHIALPNGGTIGSYVTEKLPQMIESGKMPQLQLMA